MRPAGGVRAGRRRGCDEAGEAEQQRAPAQAGAPNVLVVMTDDQDAASFPRTMPLTRRLVADRGVTFSRSFASYPLCCPSRATFFTGQLAHNNGVLGNKPDEDGGGYENLSDPERVLPVWFRDGGYSTAHVGKFVHAYDGDGPPPGWDRFWGFVDEQGNYYDYSLRGPGSRVTDHGDADHDFATTVITRLAVREIERSAPGERPFFLSVGYSAPHTGAGRAADAGSPCSEETVGKSAAQPAPEDLGKAGRIEPARGPSFNEANVADKPAAIRKRARLDAGEIQQVEQRRACADAALAAADRGVAEMLGALRDAGELDETVVIFTSDNGLFYGEHRIPGDKNRPYEEAIRVPLAIRAPGVKPAVSGAPVMNADLAPTILELAGIVPTETTARPADGRSLAGLLEGGESLPGRAIPIEGRSAGTQARGGGFRVRSYQGVRTSRYLYAAYYEEEISDVAAGLDVLPGTGKLLETELYDLRRDPLQLVNRSGAPGYVATEADLALALEQLSRCEGEACTVEVKPHRPG